MTLVFFNYRTMRKNTFKHVEDFNEEDPLVYKFCVGLTAYTLGKATYRLIEKIG